MIDETMAIPINFLDFRFLIGIFVPLAASLWIETRFVKKANMFAYSIPIILFAMWLNEQQFTPSEQTFKIFGLVLVVAYLAVLFVAVTAMDKYFKRNQKATLVFAYRQFAALQLGIIWKILDANSPLLVNIVILLVVFNLVTFFIIKPLKNEKN